MGVADKAGVVEAGMQADFLVLNGNPYDDIKKSRNIRMIMKRGKSFFRIRRVGNNGKSGENVTRENERCRVFFDSPTLSFTFSLLARFMIYLRDTSMKTEREALVLIDEWAKA